MLQLPPLFHSFILLLTGISSLSNATLLPRASDRCLPGQSCFPDQKTLSAFNSSVGGTLVAERPVEAVCFLKDPLYNQQNCDDVKSNRPKDEWINQHFGAMAFPNWETCSIQDSCINTNFSNGTCGQGSVPNFSVEARNAEDVVNYVKFATKHNLNIVVKSTGHDNKGRSAGKDGFALWTRNLQERKFDQAFIPKDCKVAPQPAFTFGGGVVWDTAYQFAEQNKKLVVGAAAGFVAVGGGWLQGGGHSFPTSPSYGLGVDNLLEMDIVTADGKFQTISECSNPDLFFAVRGGGGGTWGVATRVTYKAHDSVPFHLAAIRANGTIAKTSDPLQGMIELLAQAAPKLSAIGGGGFTLVTPSFLKNGLFILALLPGKSPDDLKAALDPVLKGVTSSQAPVYVTYPSFYEFYKVTLGPMNLPLAIPTSYSSRLITKDAFKDPKAVAKAVVEARGKLAPGQTEKQNPIQIISAGPSTAGNNSKKTSVNPAWYDTLWQTVFTGKWAGDDSIDVQKRIYKGLHDAGERLRELVPNSGVYQNEADVYQSNHIEDFWGKDNYNRLVSIKKKVDPSNFFSVWQGIGWEGPESSKFQCYKQNAVPGVNLID